MTINTEPGLTRDELADLIQETFELPVSDLRAARMEQDEDQLQSEDFLETADAILDALRDTGCTLELPEFQESFFTARMGACCIAIAFSIIAAILYLHAQHDAGETLGVVSLMAAFKAASSD